MLRNLGSLKISSHYWGFSHSGCPFRFTIYIMDYLFGTKSI